MLPVADIPVVPSSVNDIKIILSYIYGAKTYSVDELGTEILYAFPMLTGPNSRAFTASATATLALRVLGPAKVPYMVKLPRLITTVLACPDTLMAMLPEATGMLIFVAPLAKVELVPACKPVKNAPLPM